MIQVLNLSKNKPENIGNCDRICGNKKILSKGYSVISSFKNSSMYHFNRFLQKKEEKVGNKGYEKLPSLKQKDNNLQDTTKKQYINQRTEFKKKRETRNLRFPHHTKKKKIRGVLGKIYISSTKNNTILTLVDIQGNTKGWSCSGSLGFKNARKSTTYAAQAAAESIVKKAKILGYTHLRLRVKGLGRGKQSSLRALIKSGLKIISLEDKTGIPYNGCRASKKRRV